MLRPLRYFSLLVVLGLVLMASLNVGKAQTSNQPDTIIDAAFKDLSQRLGQNVTRSNVDNWAWEEDIFPDTSLGCPAAGKTYTQGTTRGYKITIVYKKVTYDYRASHNGQTLILCVNGTPA